MNANESLAEALRRLPQVEPPTDLFSDIAATLKARRSRRRWLIPASLAASVALGWLLVASAGRGPAVDDAAPSPVVATTTPAAASPSLELERLSEYSRRLEAWLADVPDGAPRDGRSLMAAAELEDLVGLVDMQLSAARNPAESLPLWRQRVALLEDLAAVRSDAARLAVQDIADAGSNPIL